MCPLGVVHLKTANVDPVYRVSTAISQIFQSFIAHAMKKTGSVQRVYGRTTPPIDPILSETCVVDKIAQLNYVVERQLLDPISVGSWPVL